MKTNIKKFIALVTTLIMVMSLIPSVTNAARVGDVIGYAQPTDIIATINGYQLESYNVNDLTYICVEDLRHYGFDVYYDNNTRSLSVTRNNAISIDPQNTNPYFWNIGTNTVRKPILYTDIVTYINGNYVSSSNINGRTIINFNDLAAFGEVNYNNDNRKISLSIEGIYYNLLDTFADLMNEKIGYNETWIPMCRAKGDLFIIRFTARWYMNQSDRNDFIYHMVPDEKEGAYSILNTIKGGDIPVSSVYVEYINTDGSMITSFQVY